MRGERGSFPLNAIFASVCGAPHTGHTHTVERSRDYSVEGACVETIDRVGGTRCSLGNDKGSGSHKVPRLLVNKKF